MSVRHTKSLWVSVRSYLGDTKGATAITVGLSILGMCAALGGAVDFNRVTNAQARAGAALDAATLHVANIYGKTDGALTAIANSVLLKNYGTSDDDGITDFNLVVTPSKLTATAKVNVHTTFMSLVGVKDVNIPVSVEVVRGGKSIEVALVLDNTGSMSDPAGGGSGSRIEVLRAAARDFVNTVIADNQTPYYSKAALVPYSATVNPGTLLAGSRRPVVTSPCPSTWGCATYRNGSNTYDMKGCVTERDGSDATTDTNFTTSGANYNYNDTCVTAPVQSLTSSKSLLISAINKMAADGATAGHIGIQWGYQMLSPSSGLSGGSASATPGSYTDPRLKKIMIIMTDGEFNMWHCKGMIATYTCANPNGDSFTQAKATCNAVKASGIEIYFVGIGLNANDPSIQQLTNTCSSGAGHVILASDGPALSNAFQTIAANLSEMRVSK